MESFKISGNFLGWKPVFVIGFFLTTAHAAEPDADLAIQGYCPVSYFRDHKAVKGDEKFSASHHGLRYLFAGEDALKLFQSNPEKYLPQFGGLCTTALGGTYGNRLPSDPEVFYVREEKLYLFSSLRARNAFDRKPDEYIHKCIDLYDAPELGGYCPVSYQTQGKAVRGSSEFRQVHKGFVYTLSGTEAVAAFAKEPDRYVPRYAGFCAEGVSRGKKYRGDPTTFAVYEGRTYLFFDEKARSTFTVNMTESVKSADQNWPAVRSSKNAP